MFELLDNFRKILYFHDWDTLIWISTLIVAIWARNSWLDNEKFKEKLKLLDKLENYIKKFAYFLEEDRKNHLINKEALYKLKTDLKYIILDFECILKNSKWDNTLKDHFEDIRKLTEGYALYSLAVEKVNCKKTMLEELEEAEKQFDILTKNLEKLYEELKKEIWSKK